MRAAGGLGGAAWHAQVLVREARLHIALWRPQIPANTGNIARLALGFNARLHLVGALGFRLDERAVRRAGLDYWHLVDVHTHRDMHALCAALPDHTRFAAFSSLAEHSLFDERLVDAPADPLCLVFGAETFGLRGAGVDEAVRSAAGQRLRNVLIPMQPSVRCLNLANSVAIGLAEAARQVVVAASAAECERRV